MRLDRLRERIHESLWFIPAVFVISAIGLALILVEADRHLPASDGLFFTFNAGPAGARAVLSTIATAMITFTAVVFSVTMLVLQQASSQFSPRVLRTYLRDTYSQVALGLFSATFTYALVVLPAIQAENESLGNEAVTPTISVSTAILLVLLSVAMFVLFISHIAHAIKVSSIIERVAGETREAIDRLYPEEAGTDPDGPEVPLPSGVPTHKIPARASGPIVAVDEGALLELAQLLDAVVSVPHYVGQFVPEGAPVVHVWQGEVAEPGAILADTAERLRQAISLGAERSMYQDAAFGFRQLVDIAERGLSPAVNDPTTAVQALDQVHALLRHLGGRRFPSPVRLDDEGEVRLILARPGWEEYVALGLDEIAQYGETAIQIRQRMRELIADLLVALPAHRWPPLESRSATPAPVPAQGREA